MKMEGLDIPEDLRAKLMAHLGVSGNKIFSKKIETYKLMSGDSFSQNLGINI